jgi:hypothetical protein
MVQRRSFWAYFDDGRFGWLAEAQGTVAILFDITDPEVTRQVRDQLGHYESPDHMLGGEIVINSVHLLVSDIKKSECVVVEGETPRMSSLGTHYTAIDFMGTGGEIATAEFMAQPSAQRIFLGQYVTMADLRLTNLREIAGWQDR